MRGSRLGTRVQCLCALMSLALIRVVRPGTDLLRLIILYAYLRGNYSMLGPYYPRRTPEIVHTIWV